MTLCHRNWKCIVYTHIVALQLLCCPNLIQGIQIEQAAYHDINIEISDIEFVQHENCRNILKRLEHTLTTASSHLYNTLNGYYYFGSFNIHLPDEWNDTCIPATADTSIPSTGGKMDIKLIGSHSIYGDNMWTEQYGSCGVGGNNIFIPFDSLVKSNSGLALAKEWLKYRYGVFDENGYENDDSWPMCFYDNGMYYLNACTDHKEADQSCRADGKFMGNYTLVPALFCDVDKKNGNAPTKQNQFCNRAHALSTIREHSDFRLFHFNETKNVHGIHAGAGQGVGVGQTHPKFNYKRNSIVRYVVVIDDTNDIAVRESWHFLRTALRKWVVYDLLDNTEVGVVLANGRNIQKSLELKPLKSSENRDLVASFIPYTPTNVRQVTCLACAIEYSVKLLQRREQIAGKAANVVIVIAPGMDSRTNYVDFKTATWRQINVRLATINYPHVLPARLPLDKLITSETEELVFTVFEKKYNFEKSYLSTYFELSNALSATSRFFDNALRMRMPIEIHRNVISDRSVGDNATMQRNTVLVEGQFYVERNYINSAEFYVYTHSIETPLIQAIRIISPNGSVYTALSDQRLPVKQMMVIAPVQQIGIWRYQIERYMGNPQPHIVQVLARPTALHEQLVEAHAWAVFTDNSDASYFHLYCKVQRGKYPIIGANADIQLHYKSTENNTEISLKLALLDNGNGDSDLMYGDGIYSRKIVSFGAGIYTFNIEVSGKGEKTFVIRDLPAERALNLSCCAHEIQTLTMSNSLNSYFIGTGPFERHVPALTYFLESNGSTHTMDYIIGTTPITTLRGKQKGNQISLNWTNFDFYPGVEDLSYDIKYAYTSNEIIESFDELPLLATIDVRNETQFGTLLYEFYVDDHSSMYGNFVFFAVRARAIGQISNIVVINIPAKALPSSTTPAPTITNTSDHLLISKQETSNSGITSMLNEHGSVLVYGVIAALLATLILFLIFLLCMILRCRRAKTSKTVEANKSTERIQATHGTNSSTAQTEDVNNGEYTFTETLECDHHILGIPTIYNKDLLHKAASNCGSINYDAESNQFSNNFMQHTEKTCYLYPQNDQLGYMYNSSVSQMVQQDYCHAHQPQRMPVNEYIDDSYDINSLDSHAPPVPPLPLPLHQSTFDWPTQQISTQTHANLHFNMNMNSPLLAAAADPTISQQPNNIYNQAVGIPTFENNPSPAQLFESVDKRRRNVTMV